MATILGWIGLGGDTPTDDGETKPKELEGAEGKPAGGWFSAMLKAIFSPTLLLFLLGPVGWILGFLGFAVKAAGAADTASDTGLTGDPAIDGKKGQGEPNIFAKILRAILPPSLIDFIVDPIDWVLKFLGWKDEKGEVTAAGTSAAGIIVGGSWKEKAGLFTSIISSIIPQWMKDFMSGPIDFIKAKLGWTTTTEDETATKFFDDWKLPTWDSFKQLLPEWLSDPVGWVTGLFKKGEEVGEEEKARIAQKVLLEGGKEQSAFGKRLGDSGMSRDEVLAEYKRAKEANEDISLDLSRAAKEASKWYATQATQMGIMTRGERITGTKESKWNIDETNKAMTAGMAAALQMKVKGGGGGGLIERQFTDDKDKDAIVKMAEAGTTTGSLFTHDVHVEQSLKALIQPLVTLANAQNALLSAYGGGSGNSSTTINNITNAPSTVNQSSSSTITENSYGVADPYTSAAGAYG